MLQTEATKELLDREKYDAIVLAVGADPIIPKEIPGSEKPHVAWAPYQTRVRLRDIATGNVRAFLEGNPQNNVAK